MLNIVLYEPEIPPNTGNIIRLAANTGSALHLIKPLGFELDDRRLRRAGLDYHEFSQVTLHESWPAFLATLGSDPADPDSSILANFNEQRLFGISTRGRLDYTGIDYKDGDYLIFGPETRGLPESVREQLGETRVLRIPMLPESRSLNLSNAVAVVVYEAWRQLQFPGSRQRPRNPG
ncbi:MAG: tRNA (uridine(34)/cytosine(34)/5-carboxymethylaminomethyluridine(34)-2'-O)-methyltransferase TrmL [Gammaproteobacteria bacterium]|nr:tRNA (uridine(34)/cytosine(34)/5-carboxymethylaminomethyluridine(34)-2'-O)-methyltransferase TrmL [Pseudomonadales bacterium]MCP5347308.1 tRNA (uridine(34)/cytosine(34)/5-carboxymethylaminomethyluridine(34)-2'-O)-methyltransferase TrmL [Pseudomonadales bacterium]